MAGFRLRCSRDSKRAGGPAELRQATAVSYLDGYHVDPDVVRRTGGDASESGLSMPIRQPVACRPASAKRHLRAGQAPLYRVTWWRGRARARVAGWRAVAGGCVTLVLPTADPGCWVGRSVPAACGKPFVVFGVDWLEFPAGGVCVVVNEFCAKAGAAPRMTSAAIKVLMVGVPLWFVGKGCSIGLAMSPRLGVAVPAARRGQRAFSGTDCRSRRRQAVTWGGCLVPG